jgi:hypothetical protein
MLWDKDGEVGFKIKPRRGRDGKAMKDSPRSISLPKQEFLDRFVSHILPKGFRRVRMSGLYATNERARLGIARGVLKTGRKPSDQTLDTVDEDSLEAEFSGDREGQSTYRVRCQKCVDQPPMQREGRLTGRDTMRCLAFIIAMQMYFSGKRSTPPEPRPDGLPSYFAMLEDQVPFWRSSQPQQAIKLAGGLPTSSLGETHPP